MNIYYKFMYVVHIFGMFVSGIARSNPDGNAELAKLSNLREVLTLCIKLEIVKTRCRNGVSLVDSWTAEVQFQVGAGIFLYTNGCRPTEPLI